MKIRAGTLRIVLVAGVVLIAGLLLLWRVRARSASAPGPVPVERVGRQNITVTIEATGTVEPIDLVEVKSKASGQILTMPVEVGSVVRRGALLAQIDTVDVQNQYDQAYAALRAARARSDISRAQKKRADDLLAEGVITATEHESATLDDANAQAALVKARTDLDSARQRREDAIVRAPVTGTVLEQLVTVGQVISSATSSVSGGTSLLRMADLGRIRLRALVSETDIGSVHPGQTATVTVDAFPNRPFQGTVDKIEPQAVVQQSVTMFPVLVSIANEGGLLLPGMNGEVSMLVDERDGVLAVPVDAVRTQRELPAVALALGLDADSVRVQVERQIAQRALARATGRAAGDSSLAGRVLGRGGAGADTSRGRMRAGGRRWPGAGGAAGGSAGGFAGGAPGGGAGRAMGAFASAGGASGARAGGRASRSQVVFVQTTHGLEPRVVLLGLTNFDYAQVIDGVKEGEEVALLSVAELQAKRKQDQTRLRERLGGGLPGAPGAGAGGGGRGAGGAGGGGGAGGAGRAPGGGR